MQGEQSTVPTVDVEAQSVTEKLGPSLVTVDFGRPFPINGITSEQFRGTGVVVDTERGLVVTDRMTVTQSQTFGVYKVSSLLQVPSSLGSAAITFDNSQMVRVLVCAICARICTRIKQISSWSCESLVSWSCSRLHRRLCE